MIEGVLVTFHKKKIIKHWQCLDYYFVNKIFTIPGHRRVKKASYNIKLVYIFDGFSRTFQWIFRFPHLFKRAKSQKLVGTNIANACYYVKIMVGANN